MLMRTAGKLWYEEIDLEYLEMLAIYSGDPRMVPRDYWFNGVMPFSMVFISSYSSLTGIAHSFRGSPQYLPGFNRIRAVIMVYLDILFLVG